MAFGMQNEARKANQTAMVSEKKKMEAPSESRGISKQKWLEDRKKKIGKLLDANGLDMTKAYMLDTQEAAEVKYKKWEKDPAPFGWDGMFITPLTFQSFHITCTFYSAFHVGVYLYVEIFFCFFLNSKHIPPHYI
jgi:hypothetical protein